MMCVVGCNRAKAPATCKENLRECVKRVATDVVVLVSMYTLALYLIDGVTLDAEYMLTNVPKYAILFFFGSLIMRYLDRDDADALSRGAAVVIAAKFVSALAPKSP